MRISASLIIPFTSRSFPYYNYNYGNYNLKDYNEYQCNGKYMETAYDKYVTINFPNAPHYSYNIGSYTYQQLPDRFHVKLFDMNIMPVTLTTSAILRKHLF